MPSLSVTATTTKEIKLEPKLRRQLLTKLRTYDTLRTQMKAIEHSLDKLKDEIGGLRDETGEQSLQLEGFTVTLVAPTYKKFNPKRFVAAGGDLTIYDQAVEIHPKKAYTKVTVPGSKDEGED